MHKLRALALVMLAVGLLLAGPTPGIASARTTPAPAPDVGTCHNLTWKQFVARSDNHATVACSGMHRSLTVATPTLPAGIARTDSTEIFKRIGAKCDAAAAEAVGGWKHYLLSIYALAFFVPTQAQWSGGARWVRCDVVLRGAGKHLQPLPAPTQLKAALVKRNTWCRTGRSTNYSYVPCTHKHQFRATILVKMSSWKNAATAHSFAIRACSRRVSTAYFSYTYPTTRRYFNVGWRYVACAPQTRR